MAVSKVTFDGNTLIDLENDTTDAAYTLNGYTGHKADGTTFTGSIPLDANSNHYITTRDGKYTIPQGYHNGSAYVQIGKSQRDLILPENIKSGVTFLGITGTYSGSGGASITQESNNSLTIH